MRAKRPERLPMVLGRAEVSKVLGQLRGTPCTMASLLYGPGLRSSAATRPLVFSAELELELS